MKLFPPLNLKWQGRARPRIASWKGPPDKVCGLCLNDTIKQHEQIGRGTVDSIVWPHSAFTCLISQQGLPLAQLNWKSTDRGAHWADERPAQVREQFGEEWNVDLCVRRTPCEMQHERDVYFITWCFILRLKALFEMLKHKIAAITSKKSLYT